MYIQMMTPSPILRQERTMSTTQSAPTRGPRKTSQIILRIDPKQKQLLEDAAAASGRSVTDIVTEGARDKALQILREEAEIETLQLTYADKLALVEALINPPEPTPQMIEQYRKYLEFRERFGVQSTS